MRMITYVMGVITGCTAGIGCAATTTTPVNVADRAAIQATVQSYEKALNGADIEGVLRSYADDGVFMAATKPTATGTAQLRGAYTHVFADLGFDVKFNIAEAVSVGDLAYVWTNSVGAVKLLKKGITLENAKHRELFILRRGGDGWRISRYMFNRPVEK